MRSVKLTDKSSIELTAARSEVIPPIAAKECARASAVFYVTKSVPKDLRSFLGIGWR